MEIEGEIDMTHVKNAPITQALIWEVWRLYPSIPLALPHQAIENTQLAGFPIKKGSVLIFHIWSIHRDPEIWGDEAEKFNPYRFLTHNPETKSYSLNKRPKELITFSAGMRACPGENFAQTQTFILLANLLKYFKIVATDALPPFLGNPLLIHNPPEFKVIVRKRDTVVVNSSVKE